MAGVDIKTIKRGYALYQQFLSSTEIASVPLFHSLKREQLQSIAAHMQRLELADGEQLFAQEQAARAFYLLQSGNIVLKRTSMKGDEKVMELVQPGQTFAEAVMFMDRHTYPVSATSSGHSVLLEIDSDNFKSVLAESIDTCFRIMGDLSVRLRRWVEEIDRLTLQNATCRIIGYLNNQLPHDADGGVEVVLPAPKNRIASRLSITPETLSRIFSELQHEGLLSIKGKVVRIPDIDAFRRANGGFLE